MGNRGSARVIGIRPGGSDLIRVSNWPAAGVRVGRRLRPNVRFSGRNGLISHPSAVRGDKVGRTFWRATVEVGKIGPYRITIGKFVIGMTEIDRIVIDKIECKTLALTVAKRAIGNI